MESYIDFIKQYNEKSVTSSEDSDFENFLKGGGNKSILGGFPKVYDVSETSKLNTREYASDISNILNTKVESPFLNVELGGSKNDQIPSEINDIEELDMEKINVLNNQETYSDDTIDFPDKLQFTNAKTRTIKDEFNVDINMIEDSEQEGGQDSESVKFPDFIEVENNDITGGSDTVETPVEEHKHSNEQRRKHHRKMRKHICHQYNSEMLKVENEPNEGKANEILQDINDQFFNDPHISDHIKNNNDNVLHYLKKCHEWFPRLHLPIDQVGEDDNLLNQLDKAEDNDGGPSSEASKLLDSYNNMDSQTSTPVQEGGLGLLGDVAVGVTAGFVAGAISNPGPRYRLPPRVRERRVANRIIANDILFDRPFVRHPRFLGGEDSETVDFPEFVEIESEGQIGGSNTDLSLQGNDLLTRIRYENDVGMQILKKKNGTWPKNEQGKYAFDIDNGDNETSFWKMEEDKRVHAISGVPLGVNLFGLSLNSGYNLPQFNISDETIPEFKLLNRESIDDSFKRLYKRYMFINMLAKASNIPNQPSGKLIDSDKVNEIVFAGVTDGGEHVYLDDRGFFTGVSGKTYDVKSYNGKHFMFKDRVGVGSIDSLGGDTESETVEFPEFIDVVDLEGGSEEQFGGNIDTVEFPDYLEVESDKQIGGNLDSETVEFPDYIDVESEDISSKKKQ